MPIAIIPVPAILAGGVPGVIGIVAPLGTTVDVGTVAGAVVIVIVPVADAVVAVIDGVDEDAVIVSCGVVVWGVDAGMDADGDGDADTDGEVFIVASGVTGTVITVPFPAALPVGVAPAPGVSVTIG